MLTGKYVVSGCFAAILSVLAGPALAGGQRGNCSFLQGGWNALKNDLKNAVGVTGNGGLGNNMWATVVDNSGIVCAVAFSGNDFTTQWLGSRVISAQKANTGNAFSLGVGAGGTVIALSSANLYSAVQPGGSLYGLQASNPVETDVAYGNGPGNSPPANASSFGTPGDPLVGDRVGGINVFGGGLALYAKGGKRVGGLGVSGDTSCTDHMVAWRTRHALGLDQFGTGVGGVSGTPGYPDNIIFDIQPNPDQSGSAGPFPYTAGDVGHSTGGFGHPTCLNPPTLSTLPAVQ
jgi:Haem degrading protein HbpS-like